MQKRVWSRASKTDDGRALGMNNERTVAGEFYEVCLVSTLLLASDGV